ncbi:amino acid transporter, partial [Streptomyces sp. NPDC127036]
LMLLQLLAAIAVPFYFRRITHQEGVLRTVVAPAVATVLLGVAIVLVCTHLDLFTGASSLVNTILASVAPVVFILGLVLARRLRRSKPDVFDRFAAEPADDPDAEHAGAVPA